MIILMLIVAIGLFVFYLENESRKFKNMTQEEKLNYGKRKQEEINRINYGTRNTLMKCPYCETVGKVRTKAVKVKRGISDAKVATAVITGGSSLIATGLSRKEKMTQAYCEHCGNTWKF